MMKEVEIPTVDGKYKALFPPKCVYCGAPKEVTRRKTASSGNSRRRRFVTVEAPYCAEHARESKRNARVLTTALIAMTLVSCGVLFGIATSINRNPPTGLLVFLALLAVGLAYVGREVLRRMLSRSRETMADMTNGELGFKVTPLHDKVVFSFTNGRIAAEFAQLNGQEVS
ncbi:MAG: hypothetical protein GY803_21005 [Chloroflexi bacterium]|nr:hypothetical protein [Chloroflexota bacterium]